MGRPPARFINRSLKRGTATHVAAISHLPQIQALLPQFVLLNIILLDVAPCHIDASVISAANRLNLWLIYVPARLTFMLQPLDVSCLQAYKSVLHQLFMERQDNDGTLRTKEWFNVLSSLNKLFWRGRNWKTAFHNVGLLGQAKSISDELRQLGGTRLTDSPTALPSETQLQEIWPRRKTIPFKSLFWLPAKLKPVEID